jgi:penicillin amidase
MKEAYCLATRWSGADGGARSINALLDMWTARTATDGMASFAKVESAFNWVFADRAGNIGYQMSGLMPRRSEGWSGFAPRPGWDERFDWRDRDGQPRSQPPRARKSDQRADG